MRYLRKKAGATLALAVACTLFLTMLGLGFFWLLMLFGGAKEFRHSVDAASLAVARKAMTEPTVPLTYGSNAPFIWCEPAFAGVCQPYGGMNLKNYNVLAGQAFLITMNEAAMESEGYSTQFNAGGPFSWPDSYNGSIVHARQINKALAVLNAQLNNQLTNPYQTFNKEFDAFAQANSVRMLGAAKATASSANWGCAYVNPGEASNLAIESRQVPRGYTGALPTVAVDTGDGVMRNFVQGYVPIDYNAPIHSTTGANTTMFVPMRPPHKVHLHDMADFQAHTTAPSGTFRWFTPLPNAFKTSGGVKVAMTQQIMDFASAAAVDSVDRGFTAALPQGFITVDNQSDKPLSLGRLFAQSAFNMPIGTNGQSLRDRILQRLWQVDPAFQASDLRTLLSTTALAPHERGFLYIDPLGKQLTLSRDSAVSASWLTTALRNCSSDCTQVQTALPQVDIPDSNANWHLIWQPATGYNGLLGRVAANAS